MVKEEADDFFLLLEKYLTIYKEETSLGQLWIDELKKLKAYVEDLEDKAGVMRN